MEVTIKQKIYFTSQQKEVPLDWDTLLPENHNLKLAALATITAAKINDIVPYYIWIEADNKIIGLCYAQLFRFKSKYINTKNLNAGVCLISKFALGCLPLKILVIGNLFRHDGAYNYFVQKNDAPQLLHSIVTHLKNTIGASALFLKDFTKALAAPFADEPRYLRSDNDVSMRLQIPESWHTFEDYAQALKHKYKQRLQKMQKAFAPIISKPLTYEAIVAEKENIFNLYYQVTQNQTVTFGHLNADYFVLLKQQMKEKLHVHGFYLNNKLIAFSSAIVQDGEYDMNYIGFDYALNSQYNLYFNMLFYFIACALKEKCNTLVLGRTALEAKAILGCTPKNIYGYYYIKSNFFNTLAQKITSRLNNNQGDLWKERHPFKSEHYGE